MAILLALTKLARGEHSGDVKKLVDDPSERFRLRVGDWRVLFRYETNLTLRIYSVGNRKDIYRD